MPLAVPQSMLLSPVLPEAGGQAVLSLPQQHPQLTPLAAPPSRLVSRLPENNVFLKVPQPALTGDPAAAGALTPVPPPSRLLSRLPVPDIFLTVAAGSGLSPARSSASSSSSASAARAAAAAVAALVERWLRARKP